MFHILVIDDDKNIRYFLKEVLELEHYTVYTAKDGVEALNIFEKEFIDLVIVDIMMPNMNGYEFTKTLRLTNDELPILMISAKQLPNDRKLGFKAGIDDFMSKPLDNEELILHVKALLRRSKINNERKIVINDITLDYDSYTITKKDEVIELPQKEFLLLYKLLSYPNKIFTKMELMDEIWGIDCDTGWETLTVHVNRLRKRLENFDDIEIVSIRGLGYKAVKKNEVR